MMRRGVAAAALALLLAAGTAHAAGVDVTTWHNDNFRSGWNQSETVLTPHNVAGPDFKLLKTVTLDEQVDAQPLVLSDQKIKGHSGTHTVVYVATENNSVYAIDGDTGKILRKANFGAPVPIDDLPGGCDNNGTVVGIGSTPVIDRAHDALYVITDNFQHGHAAYRLHTLSLADLSDKTKPIVISAAAKLTGGTKLAFNPDVERQRAALLLSGKNLYAGFASYCDYSADQSRGWVMSWQVQPAKDASASRLLNRLATSPSTFFLSSVWMSGAGIAADENGFLYFVTGNSDPSGNTLSTANPAESAVSLTANLGSVRTSFTPQEFSSLEAGDTDFGSGGIMLLPPQHGTKLNLATALGKSGALYLLDRDAMGNYQPGGPDDVLDTEFPGSCWCAESYFTGSDGLNRVISSANNTITTWKVHVANPHAVTLDQDISADLDHNGQAPGFMTSVSSNGEKHGIIWAVGRPDGSDDNAVHLNAFDANTGAPLVTDLIAGTWVQGDANANIVPTVANGKVYVAAYKTLTIFGVDTNAVADTVPHLAPPADTVPGHAIFGTVESRDGARIELRRRDGTLLHVDAARAIRARHAANGGKSLLVRGDYGSGGRFIATSVLRAKDNAAHWRPDR